MYIKIQQLLKLLVKYDLQGIVSIDSNTGVVTITINGIASIVDNWLKTQA